MTIATQQPAIHFTSFAVQQCIRVNYSDEVVYRNIHPSQDPWALGAVNDASFQEAQRETGEAFTLVTVDDTEGEGVIVASERCEAYYIAHDCRHKAISLCNGEYGGLYWRILAFTGGKENLEDAHQMMVGNCEESIRAACEALSRLVDLPNAMRKHSKALDEAEVAPDGESYNQLLSLAGI
ncbi:MULTISPECIES: hypothetical protein [Pseudomonas]|jgi:hypothetical protein|uniref:Uncharacterized protein n=2 Tax=Pseudomonas TaxID=286 RepID=A0AAJ5S7A2_9PSED|nr:MULTISPECIES: hypothetical protein [Pseudomonas]MCT8164096.1 hypothetical protein [Pseudomonas sp. HD6422]MCT8182916.1 hypothetical protein [Pseudomonas sp. HD6421]MDH1930386.1 hypothetical protein [Pseudomonas sp. GD03696]MDM1711817.1 hypothetical protein [Pseudomonas sp. 165]ORL53117.1 hypothetical protein B7H18_03805 [Pseudomonas putida]